MVVVAGKTVDALNAPEEGQPGGTSAANDDIAQALDSAARFQIMVEHDSDPICVVDTDFRVIYANPVARATMGIVELQQWRRHSPETRQVHPADLPRLERAVIASRRHGGCSTTDARIQMPDGDWHWFDITVCDLRSDPVVSGLFIKLRDIDRIKRSESALQEQVDSLRRQNENKSAFLSTISHEFRTPLTSIIGYSEFLTSNASSPDMVTEDAEVIHREATRLSRLVDDVLLMDRVDNGHLSLSLQPVDINQMVAAVAEAMRPLLARQRLVQELDPALPRVMGDRDRLEQALTNLISNAVKFSDHGGAITLATSQVGKEVVLAVRDEGMGIAPEDLERIFQRFERVETGIAGQVVGTGLGLAIVSEIATLHQGRVWVESVIGEGSTFSIALPLLAP